MSVLRIRKWWHAGTEVTIRLTAMAGDEDCKRLHGVVHAFSKALSAPAASLHPAPTGAPDEPNPSPVGREDLVERLRAMARYPRMNFIYQEHVDLILEAADALSKAPVGREEIARIIDPQAFEPGEGWPIGQRDALSKADAIIALGWGGAEGG